MSEEINYVDTIYFSDSAKEYLSDLLKKQDCEGIAIRMFVIHPGKPEAETCLSYCRPDEQKDSDIMVDMGLFNAYFDKDSACFLKDAKIDFNKSTTGGQLTIKAPNSKYPQVSDDSPLVDRVNYILYNDINPSLASHGGQVTLVELTDDNIAVLEFGGGCQGCSQLDVTLKDGVEKTLLEKLPTLTGTRDITDHSDTSNAYYR